MPAFQNILALVPPTDEPDTYLEHALDLARRSGGRVRLVQTFEPLPWLERLVHSHADEVKAAGKEARRRTLAQIEESLSGRGVEVSSDLLFGRLEEEVSREVLRENHDLVVVAGHRGVGDAIPPVAIRLMRVCPAAVLVVQPEHVPPFRRVLAAIDPDPASEAKEDLARRTVRAALRLAHDEEAECMVLHAWSPFEEEALRGHLGDESFAKYRASLREAAENALHGAVEPFRSELPDGSVFLERGDARVVIPEFVRTRKVDVIVMGTVARKGLHGLLIGNTAEVVLRRTPCSVLSLKPEGFRSPVCD